MASVRRAARGTGVRAARHQARRARGYAESVTPETLERAKRRLLDLTARSVRLQAVCAVERLHERGFDVRDLEPILDSPQEVLADPDAGISAWSHALYAVEYNEKTMWTEAVLAALKATEDRLPEVAVRCRELVRMIEASLRTAWADDG